MKVVALHITVVDASTVGLLVAPLEIGKVAAVLLELSDLKDANSACIFPRLSLRLQLLLLIILT